MEHINRPFVTGASNTDFKAKQNKNKYFVKTRICQIKNDSVNINRLNTGASNTDFKTKLNINKYLEDQDF